jgi:quercetin dioxygenase-like cupin family protein
MSVTRLVAFCFLLVVVSPYPTFVLAQDAAIDSLMEKDLGTDGSEGLVIRVTYPPGGSTPVHRHDAHVFVYVLEGAITMQVTGGELTTVGTGEMFYESPTDVHAVSRNASDTDPAKFLVFMVKHKGVPPVIPIE